jgi:Zn-dependent protease
MLISLLFSNPLVFAIIALGLVIAISIHEFAHAFAAVKLGDPTPKIQGRLTLNPLSHLDPIGTLLLLIVGFGWGKPVQFNPRYLKSPRSESAIISFAGPFSNILLVTILALVYRVGILQNLFPFLPIGAIIPALIQINLVLAIFNMVPIHPLDGGKILVGLLPESLALDYDRFMHKYGMIMLLFLMFFPIFNGQTLFGAIIGPVVDALMNVYLPSSSSFT